MSWYWLIVNNTFRLILTFIIPGQKLEDFFYFIWGEKIKLTMDDGMGREIYKKGLVDQGTSVDELLMLLISDHKTKTCTINMDSDPLYTPQMLRFLDIDQGSGHFSSQSVNHRCLDFPPIVQFFYCYLWYSISVMKKVTLNTIYHKQMEFIHVHSFLYVIVFKNMSWFPSVCPGFLLYVLVPFCMSWIPLYVSLSLRICQLSQ